jgi:hypothetical protein
MKPRCNRERKTWMTMPVTSALLAVVALFIFNSVNAAAAHKRKRTPNFCRAASQASERSCQADAENERWITIAKCDNVLDADERKDCMEQVREDLKDALQSCDKQSDARDAVCKQLGGAPYDPVINPDNFSATITNELLPLKPGTTFTYESPTELNEVVVTNNTKNILGANCREVHDTVKLKSTLELTEDTLDWFCQDMDGNVWYFGENT